MLLHTVNKPAGSVPLESCLRLIRAPASILLIEDGAYAATRAHQDLWTSLPEGISIYVLEADLRARGLVEQRLERIQVVDYGGFVALCERHDKVQSWY